MSKLPKLSGHETIKALSKLGFVKKRQKGSHVILVKKTKEGKIGLCRTVTQRTGCRNAKRNIKASKSRSRGIFEDIEKIIRFS